MSRTEGRQCRFIIIIIIINDYKQILRISIVGLPREHQLVSTPSAGPVAVLGQIFKSQLGPLRTFGKNMVASPQRWSSCRSHPPLACYTFTLSSHARPLCTMVLTCHAPQAWCAFGPGSHSRPLPCPCFPAAVKIGRPGYRVTKQFEPEMKQRSLLFQVGTALLGVAGLRVYGQGQGIGLGRRV